MYIRYRAYFLVKAYEERMESNTARCLLNVTSRTTLQCVPVCNIFVAHWHTLNTAGVVEHMPAPAGANTFSSILFGRLHL